MLRIIYVWLLRLHPSAFKQRFADEMLCIFDQTRASQTAKSKVWMAFRLLGDGALSLARQWTRVAPPEEATSLASDVATANTLPVFCSLPSFKPRPGAMIYGAALSLTAFWIVFFALRYSLTHRAAIVLPVESYAAESPRDDSSPSSSGGFQLPSVTTYDNQTEAHPENVFDRGEASRPSTAEPVMLVPGTESGIEPATNPAVATPPQRNSVPRTGRLSRPGIETAPDKLSSSAGLLANPTASAYLSEAVSEPTSAHWLEAYVGTYVADTPAHLEVIVSANNGHLEIEINRHGKIVAVAASRMKFLFVGNGKTSDWIEFVPDQNGAFRELDIYCNGERQVARRSD